MDSKLPVYRFISTRMVAAAVFAMVYLGAILIAFIYASTKVYEPPLLLPILNTIFAGGIPVIVAIIAMRSYILGGLSSILCMACGLMTFGFGAILAGWLMVGPQGPNINVTIYNMGIFLGGILHAIGIIFILIKETPEMSLHRKRVILILTCFGIFVFLIGVTLAAIQGPRKAEAENQQ